MATRPFEEHQLLLIKTEARKVNTHDDIAGIVFIAFRHHLGIPLLTYGGEGRQFLFGENEKRNKNAFSLNGRKQNRRFAVH